MLRHKHSIAFIEAYWFGFCSLIACAKQKKILSNLFPDYLGVENTSFPIRFGTYEVFRIILPGFYFVGLLCLTAYLFVPTRQLFIEFAGHQMFLFAVVAGGVFLGLVLYAYDYPKKIRAYRELKMPSEYLKRKLRDKCLSPCENKIQDIGEAVDTYFYVMLELFSPGAQKRIFYIGSVYHVLADIRMLSAIFGFMIFPISLGGALIGSLPTFDAIFGLFIATFLVILWLSLHPEFIYKKRKSKGDKYLEYIVKMQRRFIDLKIDEIREKICKQKQNVPKLSSSSQQ